MEENKMKKFLALILVAVLALGVVACANNNNKPDDDTTTAASGDVTTVAGDETTTAGEEVKVMSYAEFAAAADGTDIAIESYIQAFSYAKAYGNASFFLADETGAYYVYRMPCTDDDAAKLTVGTKVRITGQKGSWAGEAEIAEGTAKYEVLEGTYTATAKEMTDNSKDALLAAMNQFVSLKDGEIVASSFDSDGDGENDTEAAVLYKYNNSGEKGDDLYFNVKFGDNTYTFVVETDFCAADSDVYAAVEALEIGAKVDLSGFMYIYNDPQLWVTAVTVK